MGFSSVSPGEIFLAGHFFPFCVLSHTHTHTHPRPYTLRSDEVRRGGLKKSSREMVASDGHTRDGDERQGESEREREGDERRCESERDSHIEMATRDEARTHERCDRIET